MFVALGCGIVLGRAAVADGVAADAAGWLGDEASGLDVVAGSADVQATSNRLAGNTQSAFTPASIAARGFGAFYALQRFKFGLALANQLPKRKWKIFLTASQIQRLTVVRSPASRFSDTRTDFLIGNR